MPKLSAVAPVFPVPDVGVSAAWYAEALGFEIHELPGKSPEDFVILSRDGVRIMLQHSDEPLEHGEGWNAYFTVAGVRDLFDSVADRAELTVALRRQPYGGWEFELVDPNGYTLVFGDSEITVKAEAGAEAQADEEEEDAEAEAEEDEAEAETVARAAAPPPRPARTSSRRERKQKRAAEAKAAADEKAAADAKAAAEAKAAADAKTAEEARKAAEAKKAEKAKEAEAEKAAAEAKAAADAKKAAEAKAAADEKKAADAKKAEEAKAAAEAAKAADAKKAGPQVRRFEDARSFLQRARSFLVEKEPENNLILGVADRLTRSALGYEAPIYLATIEDGGKVVGCAFRTPPHKLGLTAMPDAALDAVVADVADVYETLPAVLGPEAAAARFAKAWAKQKGVDTEQGMRQRIYELRRVNWPERPPAGGLRLAQSRDHGMIVRWVRAFGSESRADTHRIEEMVSERTAEEGLFLWDDGEPRSLSGFVGWTPKGVRIGYVYTPPEYRTRGYATACVAAASQRALESGRRFCFLYTDRANATSNSIYRNIGYRPVTDVADWQFGD